MARGKHREIVDESRLRIPHLLTYEVRGGKQVQFFIERCESRIGVGGAYGAWGVQVLNEDVPHFFEQTVGRPLQKIIDPVDLRESYGFHSRFVLPDFEYQEHLETEISFAVALARHTAEASGVDISEVAAFALGSAAPVEKDFTVEVAREAGIPEKAKKMSSHYACASSIDSLLRVLNDPDLQGKPVIIGGFEGLGRYVHESNDDNANQLFGNGAGMRLVTPGVTAKLLAYHSSDIGDPDGTMSLAMTYPHSGESLVEESYDEDANHYRYAGYMPQPDDGSITNIRSPSGMMRLLLPHTVESIQLATESFLATGGSIEDVSVFSIHHSNRRIVQMVNRQLGRKVPGIEFPWILTEYANVSSATNIIASLMQLGQLRNGGVEVSSAAGIGGFFRTAYVQYGTDLR